MAVVLGVVLLVAALLGAVVALRAWPLWRVLRSVRPATPERLATAAREGRLDGRVVAISGVGAPGADGVLVSAVGGDACIWHRHTVHRRQIRYRTTGTRTSQRSSLPRLVADVASSEPFALRTALGRGPSIGIDPDGMQVHAPIARPVRVLPGLASEPFPDADVMMTPLQHRFTHREWILRPGAELFVLGQVQVAGARVQLRRPSRGPNIISTRSATQLRRRSALTALAGAILAVTAAVSGAVLLTVHFV
jgi:hypothetical protein